VFAGEFTRRWPGKVRFASPEDGIPRASTWHNPGYPSVSYRARGPRDSDGEVNYLKKTTLAGVIRAD
jgi:hypothetical protein